MQDFLNEIKKLIKNGTNQWDLVLDYVSTLEVEYKRKLLWIWPSLKDINNFGELFKELKISRILSIGCGSGLLEWVLQNSLDIKSYGLEIDRNWWESYYSVKSFIVLNYADDMIALKKDEHKEKFLQNCCDVTNWEFALFFCYFNNHQAFLQYVRLYKGNWIIIIGPTIKSNAYVYSEPMPLQPNFTEELNNKWQLIETLCIGEIDILAAYKRF